MSGTLWVNFCIQSLSDAKIVVFVAHRVDPPRQLAFVGFSICALVHKHIKIIPALNLEHYHSSSIKSRFHSGWDQYLSQVWNLVLSAHDEKFREAVG